MAVDLRERAQHLLRLAGLRDARRIAEVTNHDGAGWALTVWNMERRCPVDPPLLEHPNVSPDRGEWDRLLAAGGYRRPSRSEWCADRAEEHGVTPGWVVVIA